MRNDGNAAQCGGDCDWSHRDRGEQRPALQRWGRNPWHGGPRHCPGRRQRDSASSESHRGRAGPARVPIPGGADGGQPCAGTDHHVANAIAAALADLRVGDVLLLEVEVATTVTATSAATWRPAECDPTAFLAARLASALGIIVVAAAGNGGKPLRDLAPISGAVQPFGPAAPLSGAIIVGSAEKATTTLSSGVPTHKRWSTSNHGARVDCYAWGEQVATLGHRGDVDANGAAIGFPPADGTQWYTKSFGATSAAAAIVAGAALLTQAAYKSGGGGRVLSPAAMRALLRGYGTACYDAVNENIGCMPDLAKVMTEIGPFPTSISATTSPTAAASRAPATSASALTSSSDPRWRRRAWRSPRAGRQVLVGQTNHVYVRVSNRNTVAAQNAVVKVYWAPVSTLLTPSSWKQIPNTATVNLLGPAALVAAPAITWDTKLPPATGHYCFIARSIIRQILSRSTRATRSTRPSRGRTSCRTSATTTTSPGATSMWSRPSAAARALLSRTSSSPARPTRDASSTSS